MSNTLSSITIPSAHVSEIESYITNSMNAAFERWADGVVKTLIQGDGLPGVVPAGMIPTQRRAQKAKSGISVTIKSGPRVYAAPSADDLGVMR